jgi:hypothetical protein
MSATCLSARACVPLTPRTCACRFLGRGSSREHGKPQLVQLWTCASEICTWASQICLRCPAALGAQRTLVAVRRRAYRGRSFPVGTIHRTKYRGDVCLLFLCRATAALIGRDACQTPLVFFETVRQAVTAELYERPEVWRLIGYEGPSAPLSGYLHRGFARLSCMQIGFCNHGCAIGAKWSTLHTEIRRAERTGHSIRTRSMAVRISHDTAGRVTGVVYTDETGALRTIAGVIYHPVAAYGATRRR